ncbi:MAG: hypothetical protein JJT89_13830 [Nitriliruptoraceae bacterium]|nr:hypothetical protein [Nitriliruptoraceae bacterium]
MNSRCPLPARASFRDLLRDLLGRAVQVKPGAPLELTEDEPSYLAAYRFDDGGAGARCGADGRLSAGAGAAIGAMPPKETWEEVREAGSLEGDLFEFFHEVVNVTAKLLNSPTTPHVVLREFAPVPGDVPGDIAELAATPRVRHDWTVQVEGYGEGRFAILG